MNSQEQLLATSLLVDKTIDVTARIEAYKSLMQAVLLRLEIESFRPPQNK